MVKIITWPESITWAEHIPPPLSEIDVITLHYRWREDWDNWEFSTIPFDMEPEPSVKGENQND